MNTLLSLVLCYFIMLEPGAVLSPYTFILFYVYVLWVGWYFINCLCYWFLFYCFLIPALVASGLFTLQSILGLVSCQRHIDWKPEIHLPSENQMTRSTSWATNIPSHPLFGSPGLVGQWPQACTMVICIRVWRMVTFKTMVLGRKKGEVLTSFRWAERGPQNLQMDSHNVCSDGEGPGADPRDAREIMSLSGISRVPGWEVWVSLGYWNCCSLQLEPG